MASPEHHHWDQASTGGWNDQIGQNLVILLHLLGFLGGGGRGVAETQVGTTSLWKRGFPLKPAWFSAQRPAFPRLAAVRRFPVGAATSAVCFHLSGCFWSWSATCPNFLHFALYQRATLESWTRSLPHLPFCLSPPPQLYKLASTSKAPWIYKKFPCWLCWALKKASGAPTEWTSSQIKARSKAHTLQKCMRCRNMSPKAQHRIGANRCPKGKPLGETWGPETDTPWFIVIYSSCFDFGEKLHLF